MGESILHCKHVHSVSNRNQLHPIAYIITGPKIPRRTCTGIKKKRSAPQRAPNVPQLSDACKSPVDPHRTPRPLTVGSSSTDDSVVHVPDLLPLPPRRLAGLTPLPSPWPLTLTRLLLLLSPLLLPTPLAMHRGCFPRWPLPLEVSPSDRPSDMVSRPCCSVVLRSLLLQ